MKCATFYFKDDKIEVFNSILGKETVKVNGIIVSSKYSIYGGTHTFSLKDGDEELDCKIEFGTGEYGMVMDFWAGGDPVMLSEKGGFQFYFFFVIITGLTAYFLLNFLTGC